MERMKAFTLIELLVVMAIIAFLTVGSFAGLTFGLRQARDTQRKGLVTTLNTAFGAYYSDYQGHPGASITPSINCTNAVTSPSGFAFRQCLGAFPALVKTTGKSGIKDYLEGSFNWGPVDQAAFSTQIGYYAGTPSSGSTKALRYGICIPLENINGGNALRIGGTNAGKKDCFCQGSDYVSYACEDLTVIAQ